MRRDKIILQLRKWGAALVAGMVLTGSILPSIVLAEPAGQSSADLDEKETSRTSAAAVGEEETSSVKAADEADENKKKGDGNKQTSSDEAEDAEKEDVKATPKEKTYDKPTLGDGETGILIDMKTGKVLFSHEADKKVYPASTTKIMTALIALEAIEKGEIALEGEVLVSHEAVSGLDPDSSTMNLKEGERISLHHVLEGLLIPSGNDAAMATAYAVCGDVEAFVEKMNQKAAALGLTGTHFVNPHGLHDENHYTTAADLAKIARAAMEYETFREIVEIAHIKIPPTNVSPQRYYINTNGLLSTMRYLDYYYKNATGIKTGRTTEAGNCLVSSAKNDQVEVIGVLMGGKDVKDSHKDTIRMLDYGLHNFTYLRPLSKGEILGEVKVKQGKGVRHAVLSAEKDTTVLVPKDVKEEQLEITAEIPEAAYAPLNAGQAVGTAVIKYNGEELGRVSLVTDTAVARHPLGFIMGIGEFVWGLKAVRVIVYLLGAGILLFLIYLVVSIRREMKKMSKKRRRRDGYQPPGGSRHRR